MVEAGLHTIELEIAGLLASTVLIGGFLTALFVPFDCNGEVPLP